MFLGEIRKDVEAIADNATLCDETNFISRAEAIDFIGFHIMDRIDALPQPKNPPQELLALKQEANQLKGRLADIDSRLFNRLRSRIRSGNCTGSAFKHELDKYLGPALYPRAPQEEMDYDYLDIFINGLLPTLDMPAETLEREPDMVYYQKTPARVIFELAERARFRPTDVFYDLGSGLGQVAILVHMLSGVTARGVEFEPEFCRYASASVAELNLNNITFINADARAAPYVDGTVFYMYTPFTGSMLREVLDILRQESEKRMLRVFTYGPCTLEVARQSWLISTNQGREEIYKLCEFRSQEI